MPEFEQGQRQRHIDQDTGLVDHVLVDDAAPQHAGAKPRRGIPDDARAAQPAPAQLTGQAGADQRQPDPEQAAGREREAWKKLAQSIHGDMVM
ncbi:hypothetical protein D3C87_1737850 [compost metagenome]